MIQIAWLARDEPSDRGLDGKGAWPPHYPVSLVGLSTCFCRSVDDLRRWEPSYRRRACGSGPGFLDSPTRSVHTAHLSATMKPTVLILALSAVTGAQEILWAEVDAAPSPPHIDVPIGAVPSIVHYSFRFAADQVARLLNPFLKPPPRTPTSSPTRPVTRSAASGPEPRALSVLSREVASRDGLEPPCAPLPRGAGYRPLPDTADNFLAQDLFSEVARSAEVPAGYDLAFEDLQASCVSYGYLGFDTAGKYVWIKQ